MRFVRPRVTLALLLLASAVGVHLAWTPVPSSPVAPGASWLGIVGLATVFGSAVLRSLYATRPTRPSAWLSRRWHRIERLGIAGGAAGVIVRVLASPVAPTAGSGVVSLAAVGGLVSVVGARRLGVTGPGDGRRAPQLTAGLAAVALLGVAWGDIAMRNGSGVALAVRILHLWAAGVWIGAAVWHNALVVPALVRDDLGEVRPVVRRFQRVVSLLVLAVLVTGTHQATTWLGTRASAYLGTPTGRLVGLKLVLLLSVVGSIAVTHVRTPVTEFDT